MGVVAKFFVQSKTEHAGSPGQVEVRLGACVRGKENALWSQYTPNGTISMTIRNEAASSALELGEEYLVTFEKVAKVNANDGHPWTPDPRPGHEQDTACVECGVTKLGVDGEPTHAGDRES